MKVIKNNKGISKVFAYLFSVAMASAMLFGNAQAATLDSSTQCSAGNAINGIAVGDVTGNAGGASDCWGTFDGNDPGPAGIGFQVDMNGSIMQFDFVAKQDTPGGLDPAGTDIGLVVSPAGGATSGTWEYDPAKFDPEAFIIVLKAANSPGYAAWLFEGTDADSFSGNWLVAWTVGGGPNPSNPDLSHLSVYAKDDGGGPGTGIPEPGMMLLFGFGLAGFGFTMHRRRT